MNLAGFAALTPLCPSRFTAFCDWLGVELTRGQRVFCLVAYDGLEPRDLTGDDRDMARKLFGDVDTFPTMARRTVNAVCGRASGKSYIMLALRALHLSLTVSLATLAPGQVAAAPLVAPDMKTARETLRFILGAAKGKPEIARMLEDVNKESFSIRRPDGVVSVQVFAASVKGRAIRGRSYVCGVLEECAFFYDQDTGAVNDADIYNAISPRLLKDGQMILGSSPWAELGLLHDFHQRNYGHPIDAISVHAPTLLLRDDPETARMVAQEYARDPQNAAREFGAEFMATTGEAFFDGEAIKQATDESLVLPVPRGSLIASAGADMGFSRDSAAQVVTLRDETLITVASIEELRPEKGKPLKPSTVVKTFAATAKGYGTEYVVADGHYRETVREHLEEFQLALITAPEGAGGKAESYTAVRMKLNEGRLRLPNHERFLRQLKEVRGRPTAGGGISIASPRWSTGGHGDIVSAFVLAAWDSARQMPAVAPPVYATPVERMAAEWRERIARADAKSERDEDDGGFSPVW